VWRLVRITLQRLTRARSEPRWLARLLECRRRECSDGCVPIPDPDTREEV